MPDEFVNMLIKITLPYCTLGHLRRKLNCVLVYTLQVKIKLRLNFFTLE